MAGVKETQELFDAIQKVSKDATGQYETQKHIESFHPTETQLNNIFHYLNEYDRRLMALEGSEVDNPIVAKLDVIHEDLRELIHLLKAGMSAR